MGTLPQVADWVQGSWAASVGQAQLLLSSAEWDCCAHLSPTESSGAKVDGDICSFLLNTGPVFGEKKSSKKIVSDFVNTGYNPHILLNDAIDFVETYSVINTIAAGEASQLEQIKCQINFKSHIFITHFNNLSTIEVQGLIPPPVLTLLSLFFVALHSHSDSSHSSTVSVELHISTTTMWELAMTKIKPRYCCLCPQSWWFDNTEICKICELAVTNL